MKNKHQCVRVKPRKNGGSDDAPILFNRQSDRVRACFYLIVTMAVAYVGCLILEPVYGQLDREAELNKKRKATWLIDNGFVKGPTDGDAELNQRQQDLKDLESYVKDSVAAASGQQDDPRAFEPLIAALKHSDLEVRKSAIEALGRLGDPRAVEPLIASLREGRVRDSAVEALGRLGDSRAVEPLIRGIDSSFFYYVGGSEPDATALHLLIGTRTPEVSKAFIDMMGESNTKVRTMIAEMLEDIGEPVGRLLNRSLSGEREAMIALAELDDSRALRPVIRALINQEIEVSAAAAETLTFLGDQAVEPLIAALKDPDIEARSPAARHSVAMALGKLPRSDAFLKAIVRTSGSWHWESRMVALRLLVAERNPFTRRSIGQCVQVFVSSASLTYSGILLLLAGIPLGRRWRSGSGKTGKVPGWAGWVCLGNFLVTGMLYGWLLFTGPDSLSYWSLIAVSLTPAWLALTGSFVQGAICWPKAERRVWGFVCQADFSRFEPRAHTWLQRLSGGSLIHEASWDRDFAAAYACRVCGGQGNQFTGIRRVVAVLDNQGIWAEKQDNHRLQVNWLAHRKPFDFDMVEVVNATDEEVEAFTNQMRFESEERIASRLLKMDCRVHVQCDLKDGTIRLLRLTFGKVARK